MKIIPELMQVHNARYLQTYCKYLDEQIELDEQLSILNSQAIKMLSLEAWLGYVNHRESMLRCGYRLESVVSKLKSYLLGG